MADPPRNYHEGTQSPCHAKGGDSCPDTKPLPLSQAHCLVIGVRPCGNAATFPVKYDRPTVPKKRNKSTSPAASPDYPERRRPRFDFDDLSCKKAFTELFHHQLSQVRFASFEHLVGFFFLDLALRWASNSTISFAFFLRGARGRTAGRSFFGAGLRRSGGGDPARRTFLVLSTSRRLLGRGKVPSWVSSLWRFFLSTVMRNEKEGVGGGGGENF